VIEKPRQTALPQTMRQNPIGLSSIVQVQPRLLAVPELMFCRMPQIAARAKIPNMQNPEYEYRVGRRHGLSPMVSSDISTY
jgi:hypothetical protein